MKILIVEDNIELADITALTLKKQGFAVDTAYSGEEGLRLLEGSEGYDVIILDLILPDIDGASLLKEIKSTVNTPVLALTAKDKEEDRVEGIKIGFDDYMTKPFSHQELMARLRVLYRSQHHPASEILKASFLKIDPKNQTVFKNDAPIKLTLNEFRVLSYLVKNKSKKISMEELIESVWDINANPGRAKVITTISRLRKKIGDTHKSIVKNCKGGYTI